MIQELTHEQAQKSLHELIKEVNAINLYDIPQESQFILVVNPLSKNENLNVAFGVPLSQAMMSMNNSTIFVNIPLGIDTLSTTIRNQIVQKFNQVSTYKIFILVDYYKLNQLKDAIRTVLQNYPYATGEGFSIIIYNIFPLEKQNVATHITQLLLKVEKDNPYIISFIEGVYNSGQLLFLTSTEMKDKDFVLNELSCLNHCQNTLTFQQIGEILPQSKNKGPIDAQRVIQTRFKQILTAIFERFLQNLKNYQPSDTENMENLLQYVEEFQTFSNNYIIGEEKYQNFIEKLIKLWDLLEVNDEQDEEFKELNQKLELMEQMNKLKIGQRFEMIKLDIHLNISDINKMIASCRKQPSKCSIM